MYIWLSLSLSPLNPLLTQDNRLELCLPTCRSPSSRRDPRGRRPDPCQTGQAAQRPCEKLDNEKINGTKLRGSQQKGRDHPLFCLKPPSPHSPKVLSPELLEIFHFPAGPARLIQIPQRRATERQLVREAPSFGTLMFSALEPWAPKPRPDLHPPA